MMHKRLGVALALVAVGVLIGATVVLAGAGDPDERSNLADAIAITGTTGKTCQSGYDTQRGTLIPPDDSTADNTPAATVQITKKCPGAAVGAFTSEVSTSSGGSLHLDMRATCVATGGLTNPCTVGTVVIASPGHVFFQNNNPASSEMNAHQGVWSGLQRGVWRFEVLPGGGGNARLDYRTFVVTTYSGG